jgi:hypothetical protein
MFITTGTKPGSQPLCNRSMPRLPELDSRVEKPVTIVMALLTELNSLHTHPRGKTALKNVQPPG